MSTQKRKKEKFGHVSPKKQRARMFIIYQK